MNKEAPSDKRRQERAHRELREMLENGIKFFGLWVLLLWASDHTRNVMGSGILKLAGGLCFIPGTLLRMACVLTREDIRTQVVKDVPVLDRFFFGFYVYRLAVTACFLVLLIGMYLLITYVHFT
jgi:hypothetical protein